MLKVLAVTQDGNEKLHFEVLRLKFKNLQSEEQRVSTLWKAYFLSANIRLGRKSFKHTDSGTVA